MQKTARLYSKERTIEGFVLPRTPVFSPLTPPQIFSRERRLGAIFNKLTMPSNDTIRRKLAALSSLYDYLCNRHAVLHNPVLGVRRPPSMNREGATPALGDDQALRLLEAPPAGTLKGKRDRASVAR